MVTRSPIRVFAAGVPTSGEAVQGDILWNEFPTAGAPLGWVCVESGNPGVWMVTSYITAVGAPRVHFLPDVPTSGDFVKGDVVLNSDPDAFDSSVGGTAETEMWVCVESGNPGVWNVLIAIPDSNVPNQNP